MSTLADAFLFQSHLPTSYLPDTEDFAIVRTEQEYILDFCLPGASTSARNFTIKSAPEDMLYTPSTLVFEVHSTVDFIGTNKLKLTIVGDKAPPFVRAVSWRLPMDVDVVAIEQAVSAKQVLSGVVMPKLSFGVSVPARRRSVDAIGAEYKVERVSSVFRKLCKFSAFQPIVVVLSCILRCFFVFEPHLIISSTR